MTTNLDRLNQAPPNQLPDLLRNIAVGNVVIGQVTQQLRKLNPDVAGVGPYDLSTEDIIRLPDHAKASRVLRVTVRAGGTTGEYTEKAGFGTTPTTTTVGVTPCGNLAFIATDSVTDADVTYVPENGDVVELYLPVVPGTGVCALPSSLVTKGVILLLESESVAGGLVQKMNILVPAAAAVATTKSALKVDKGSVWFAIADAVTRARVKLLVAPAKDVQAVLTADASV